jgi:hypothetical protein
MFLYPLAMPLTAAAAGGIAGFFAFSNYRRASRNTGGLLSVLIAIAVAAAVIPNATQQLYDLGMSLPTIDILQGLSYFVFAFAIAGAWMFLEASRKRWLLLTLIPVSFAQPIFWTFAFFVWTTKGFAP